jgi:hypothetical protein
MSSFLETAMPIEAAGTAGGAIEAVAFVLRGDVFAIVMSLFGGD